MRQKRVVTAAFFSILALFFAGLIVLFVLTLLWHTDVARGAVARAEANPQVRADLGEPIHEGWWIWGNMRTTGSSGHAKIAIPLKGSRKNGTVYAVAHKSAGRWTYDTLEVAVEGRPGRITLLVGEPAW